MRGLAWVLMLFILAGCSDDDISWISIHNDTSLPIYALPYTADFTDGDWIHPGYWDEFYSINCDCLDAYEYFSYYYDSLIIYIKDHEDQPVKFFKDGITVNYDPTLNPFTNPDVWKSRQLERNMPTSVAGEHELKEIMDHFFSIRTKSVKFLSDTITHQLNPAG